MPDSLLDIANRITLAAARKDAEALRRLTSAYMRMYARLGNQIEMLAEKVGDNQITTGQLARLTQWQSLRGQIEGELSDYGAYLKGELSGSAQDTIGRALVDSRRLIGAASNGTITAGFGALNTGAVERLLTFLAPNSALYARLSQLAPVNAKAIADLFVEGVGLGWNPRKIAEMIRRQFGMALTDALRMTRTAQLYAYRETTRAAYIQSGVVEGWYWLAAIGQPNTCMTCIVKHGSFHPNTERLNDHHNGRCAMLPAVRGYGNPIKQTGEEWFNAQSAAEQKALMGPHFYEAWQAGKFELSDMPVLHDNDVYGPMWNVKTLGELTGG